MNDTFSAADQCKFDGSYQLSWENDFVVLVCSVVGDDDGMFHQPVNVEDVSVAHESSCGDSDNVYVIVRISGNANVVKVGQWLVHSRVFVIAVRQMGTVQRQQRRIYSWMWRCIITVV